MLYICGMKSSANNIQELIDYHTNQIKQLQYGYNQMSKFGGPITPAMKEYLQEINEHKSELKKLKLFKK